MGSSRAVKEGWKSKISVNVGFISPSFADKSSSKKLYLDANFIKKTTGGARKFAGFTAGASYEQPIGAPKSEPAVSVNLGISADLFYKWVLKLKGQHTEGFQ